MKCTKRKLGFNGWRYCGKPAAYRIDLVITDQPTIIYACHDCAAPIIERGEVTITHL
jgi:hypothetical protein